MKNENGLIDSCQLYKYNKDICEVKSGDSGYFSTHFLSGGYDASVVQWLNYHTVSDRPMIQQLSVRLNIDVLTIEDLYKTSKRPKLEEYPSYLFFTVFSALSLDTNSPFLDKEKISFVLGNNFLISFQDKSAAHFEDVRDRIDKKRGKIRYKKADFLVFRMLESITDNYFEVLDDICLVIDEIEIKLPTNLNSLILKKVGNQKRKLIELRRIVYPLKDIATQLEKINNPLIESDNHYYFSEIKDNCSEVLDEIEANIQILDGLSSLYFAVQGQRMNEVMKVLTVISVIFIPLTFIVGVYGMNFQYMPELKMKYGYFFIVVIMLIIASLLLFVFYKRGWLKRNN